MITKVSISFRYRSVVTSFIGNFTDVVFTFFSLLSFCFVTYVCKSPNHGGNKDIYIFILEIYLGATRRPRYIGPRYNGVAV